MRTKHFIASTVVFLSCLCEARIYLWPAIIKARGERNEAQNLEMKSNQYPSFGASFTFDRLIFSLDFSQYEGESSSGNVTMETNYSDVVISTGYNLFTGEIWDFYAVASAGVYQQKIDTTVGSLVTTSNKSNDRNLIGMGAEYLIRTPSYFSAIAGGRFNWTEDLDPELAPEVYLKIGIGF